MLGWSTSAHHHQARGRARGQMCARLGPETRPSGRRRRASVLTRDVLCKGPSAPPRPKMNSEACVLVGTLDSLSRNHFHSLSCAPCPERVSHSPAGIQDVGGKCLPSFLCLYAGRSLCSTPKRSKTVQYVMPASPPCASAAPAAAFQEDEAAAASTQVEQARAGEAGGPGGHQDPGACARQGREEGRLHGKSWRPCGQQSGRGLSGAGGFPWWRR